MFYVGRLASENENFIFLEEAAWIADTGRFYNFLKDGKVNEVEPFVDPIAVNKNSIIEITPWNHGLLKNQKWFLVIAIICGRGRGRGLGRGGGRGHGRGRGWGRGRAWGRAWGCGRGRGRGRGRIWANDS